MRWRPAHLRRPAAGHRRGASRRAAGAAPAQPECRRGPPSAAATCAAARARRRRACAGLRPARDPLAELEGTAVPCRTAVRLLPRNGDSWSSPSLLQGGRPLPRAERCSKCLPCQSLWGRPRSPACRDTRKEFARCARDPPGGANNSHAGRVLVPAAASPGGDLRPGVSSPGPFSRSESEQRPPRDPAEELLARHPRIPHMRLLRRPGLLPFLAASLLGSSSSAQQAPVSNVAGQPGNQNRVWVCNKDNGTVSVIDVGAAHVLAEIPTGVHPSALAFDQAGSRVFVANRRGNVPIDRTFVSPFTGSELRGTVSVIDVATLAVTGSLSDVGVEPCGIATAPNGAYFALPGARQGTLKFYDTATLAPLVTLQFPRDLSQIPAGLTMADVDQNRDGVADTGDPRGFVIRSDSQRIYVVHNKSSYVSVIDVTLNAQGQPTAASVLTKINVDDYPFDPVFNPVPVRTIQSQGKPRFLEDIALAPDGAHLAVPHVLHNVNHDVNFNFGPGLAGNFANRVYPALTILDANNNSFGQPGDGSRRLHNELSDPQNPAEFVPFGYGKRLPNGGVPTLGGVGEPIPGSSVSFVVSGMGPGQTGQLLLCTAELNQTWGSAGTLLVRPRLV